jgi:hypothetical protein
MSNEKRESPPRAIESDLVEVRKTLQKLLSENPNTATDERRVKLAVSFHMQAHIALCELERAIQKVTLTAENSSSNKVERQWLWFCQKTGWQVTSFDPRTDDAIGFPRRSDPNATCWVPEKVMYELEGRIAELERELQYTYENKNGWQDRANMHWREKNELSERVAELERELDSVTECLIAEQGFRDELEKERDEISKYSALTDAELAEAFERIAELENERNELKARLVHRHIIGKVYDVTAENMNRLAGELDEVKAELRTVREQQRDNLKTIQEYGRCIDVEQNKAANIEKERDRYKSALIEIESDPSIDNRDWHFQGIAREALEGGRE